MRADSRPKSAPKGRRKSAFSAPWKAKKPPRVQRNAIGMREVLIHLGSCRARLLSARAKSVQSKDCRIAVQRVAPDSFDLEVQQLAAMTLGTFEDDDLVAAGASFQPCQVFAAWTLDQYLHSLTKVALVLVHADFVHTFEETGMLFFDDFRRHLVWH